MKKGKKKLKGMTLIEMIISIAIFAIMGGLLVLVGNHVLRIGLLELLHLVKARKSLFFGSLYLVSQLSH